MVFGYCFVFIVNTLYNICILFEVNNAYDLWVLEYLKQWYTQTTKRQTHECD